MRAEAHRGWGTKLGKACFQKLHLALRSLSTCLAAPFIAPLPTTSSLPRSFLPSTCLPKHQLGSRLVLQLQRRERRYEQAGSSDV